MQPYQLNPGIKKIVNGNDPGGKRGHSKKDKLVTKNANRANKKSYRQYLKLLIRSSLTTLVLCLLSSAQPNNFKVLYNAIDLETSEAFIAAGPTGYIKNDSVWILEDGSIDVLDTSNSSMMAVIVNRYNN